MMRKIVVGARHHLPWQCKRPVNADDSSHLLRPDLQHKLFQSIDSATFVICFVAASRRLCLDALVAAGLDGCDDIGRVGRTCHCGCAGCEIDVN